MHKHFPDAKAHDRWTLVFTSVIAVSTFLYMVAAIWTLCEIHAGSKDTHNLAAAASDQWRAAIGLVELVDQSFWGGSQRPWVRIGDEVKLDGQKLSVSLKNYGLVPARRVAFDFIMRDDLPEKWHNPTNAFCKEAENGSRKSVLAQTIFPNSEIQISGTVPSVSSQHWLLVCVFYQGLYLERGHDSSEWPFPGHFVASSALYSVGSGKKFVLLGTEIN
jgi:hypothetical protein